MATKSLETCLSCVYGSNNNNCSAGNCTNCDMHYCNNKDELRCRCVDIRWGQECKYYVKEASHA